jgi:hypothetical protein
MVDERESLKNNGWAWDKPAEAVPECDHVDAGSIRTDRLRTREGSEIVAHQTRESFMRATGKSSVKSPAPAPIPAGISAAEARAGLRAAYGVTLATDAEIREASRCIDRAGGSGRYRQ